MSKLRLALVQSNYNYGLNIFLPYSVGMLWSYAYSIPEIRSEYELVEFVYSRDKIEDIVNRLGKLDVLAASCYIWSSTHTKALCKAVKEANPNCLIALGGPHVPERSEGFFEECPWIDILVHHEGELTFADILLERLKDNPDYSKVLGISLNQNKCSLITSQRPRLTDLDKLPSPYLTGVFDDLMKLPYCWHPTYETDRGCPYSCLSENTLINTVHGMIPIKDLVGIEGVGVFSYSKEERRAKVVTATNIRLTGTDKELIRVHFKDGSFLDCTRDHRLIQFRKEKHFSVTRECERDAGQLEPGMKVRAINETDQSLVVKRTENLPGRHDVYCMTVPETGWFYANNVLVHNCTFCDWGSSVFTKVRRFSKARLESELDWFAYHKIDLVYSAAANFAMTDHDVELTKRMVDLKRRTGFPNKFRAAYAKGSSNKVFQVNQMLNELKMSKGATLSFQSMDQGVLSAIKRKNIGTETYKSLMKQYRREKIPTYSELIIGLAEETYNSFADGVNTLLVGGAHESLSVYLCECLPNSEMSALEYRDKYQIKSVSVPVLFYHGTPDQDTELQEHYELVTSTATLPPEDWLKCLLFSWAVQAFHCLGLTQKLAVFCKQKYQISYRNFYESLLKFAASHPNNILGKVYKDAEQLFSGIPEGKSWGITDQRFGNLVWPVEEGSALKTITENPWGLLEVFLSTILPQSVDSEIINDLFQYQAWSLKKPSDKAGTWVLSLNYNICEYLEAACLGEEVELIREPVKYSITIDKGWDGNLEEFAKEVVWYGRKGGSPFWKVVKV